MREDCNWNLNLNSILSKNEVYRLRRYAKNNRNKRTEWIEWIVIEIGYTAGLRVSEIVDLECRDLIFNGELSFIHVRNGKGGKERQVAIGKIFPKVLKEFLSWKKNNHEDVNPHAPLLYSIQSNSKYSVRAIQIMFERVIKKAGLERHHSIHHLRHTYGTTLLRKSNNNLLLVKNQMGHTSIKTTMVYLHIFADEAGKAVDKLFKENL